MIAENDRVNRLHSRGSARARVALRECFDRRLKAYALAAGAVGAGLFGAARPAKADIIYTPADTSLTNGRLFIDLNHDGINDFAVNDYIVVGKDRRLFATGLGGRNGALAYAFGASYGFRALEAGYVIGRRGYFAPYAAPMANVAATFGTVVSGPWANVNDRYLGLKFDIDGQAHFGWAEFRVRAGVRGGSPVIAATLLGYAYDTVAGQSIDAGQTTAADAPNTATPEPGTLGLLALGSLGLGFWRRKKQAQGAPSPDCS